VLPNVFGGILEFCFEGLVAARFTERKSSTGRQGYSDPKCKLKNPRPNPDKE